jgi:uncharacterized tellurite resistance protein B-like protein
VEQEFQRRIDMVKADRMVPKYIHTQIEAINKKNFVNPLDVLDQLIERQKEKEKEAFLESMGF